MKLIVLFMVLAASIQTDDALRRVGSSSGELKESASFFMDSDTFSPFHNATDAIKTACKKIAVADRAAVVRSVGQVVKSYIMSSGFDDDYRNKVKEDYSSREKPDFKSTSWQEKVTQATAANASLYNLLDEATLKGSFNGMLSTQKMILDFYQKGNVEVIKAMEAQGTTKEKVTSIIGKLEALSPLAEKNLPEFKKKYASVSASIQIENEFSAELQRYTTAMAERDAKLAFDKKAKLRSLLQSFLDASASIDFAAVTFTDTDNIRKFRNADYEQKPGDWKFYFRVGKEPVTAARSFAQQWLNELK